MIGREYLATQAATLLKLANVTSNPRAAATLRDQAARLQARAIADDFDGEGASPRVLLLNGKESEQATNKHDQPS